MTAAEQRLADLRRRYAEEIAYRAHVTSPRLQRAFAAVPRERFLEPGPWRLKSDLVDDYWTTPDADPAHLYHDVVVALDEGRGLDNGLPSLRALLFEAAAIDAGERVVHIGCGAGYYSAILAETVGPRGGVVAVEADAGLAARAEAGLGDRDNVLVVHGDGFAYDPGAADVIIVNAGVTRPAPA